MVVGITGGIGSGKTTVLNLLEKIGNVAIYNADVEAKKLMNSSDIIREHLVKLFGEQAYQNGILQRAYIASVVFNDSAKLAALNAIVHPEVYQHFTTFIQKNTDKEYIVYENAILFENKSDVLCDSIVFISVNKEERIQRVMLRDKVSRDVVEARINNQWQDEKKAIQSNYIIYNYNVDETRQQVERIHNILTNTRL